MDDATVHNAIVENVAAFARTKPCRVVSPTESSARTHIHTYMYIYYIHTYSCTYIHTIYLHTYIHTYIHTYVRTYVRTYVHIYIHTYIHTYVHCNSTCIKYSLSDSHSLDLRPVGDIVLNPCPFAKVNIIYGMVHVVPFVV